MTVDSNDQWVFATLGPKGTCHENAVQNYLRFHGIAGQTRIHLVADCFEGLEMVRAGTATHLVQCSAHVGVHLITEKYHREVAVVDTFMYPTKELAILECADVAEPRTLGLVKATEGYLEGITYPERVFESTKPIVGANLLAGKYDAGLTHIEWMHNYPGRFRLRKYIGCVLTTWLVYGKEHVYDGDVLGVAPRGFYHALA